MLILVIPPTKLQELESKNTCDIQDRSSEGRVSYFLLCISGIDGIENFKIYEKYMHFGQISDKKSLKTANQILGIKHGV